MNKSVKVIPFPEIENAYLIISCYRYEDDDPDMLRSVMTFFYDNKTCGTEWEPQYGPIQYWIPTPEDSEVEKKEHYFYPYVEQHSGSWSQLAVEREGLKPAFFAGDYKYIFAVLAKWADR